MIGKFLILFAAAIVFVASETSFGQDPTTTKKVIVNPDGSFTVIEYPVGKEVTVNLLPAGSTVTGKGTARVMRSADGTRIWVDVTGAGSDVTTYYAYAIDPTGAATLLGPIAFSGGTGKAEFSTPMSQFMVVLSPTEGITAFDPTTAVVFRSEAPAGYKIIPRRMGGDTTASAVASSVITKYDVQPLNVPSFGDSTRELKIHFTGELQGLEGKAYITRKKGSTKVKMNFDDMNKVPKNKRFVLWAASPDGKYTKLGQVINSGRKEEAVINSETSLNDFGLFVTVEDADVNIPTSTTYSVFTIGPVK